MIGTGNASRYSFHQRDQTEKTRFRGTICIVVELILTTKDCSLRLTLITRQLLVTFNILAISSSWQTIGVS